VAGGRDRRMSDGPAIHAKPPGHISSSFLLWPHPPRNQGRCSLFCFSPGTSKFPGTLICLPPPRIRGRGKSGITTVLVTCDEHVFLLSYRNSCTEQIFSVKMKWFMHRRVCTSDPGLSDPGLDRNRARTLLDSNAHSLITKSGGWFRIGQYVVVVFTASHRSSTVSTVCPFFVVRTITLVQSVLGCDADIGAC